MAVEWDDNAAETYRMNFPETPLYHGDILKLSVEEALSRTGLKPGGLDVLDGSPPCQGFSTAGKRSFNDSRNQLFLEYVRLLQGLNPKVFVMENVSGLVKGKMKLIFAEIMRSLKGSGYVVTARLMDAKYFNVPQSRKRMIFIGVREDLGVSPSHPRPSARPLTVGEALRGVRPGPGTPELSERYRKIWHKVPVGGSMADTLCKRSHFNDVVKLDPGKPSKTLLKMCTGRGFATFCHWAEPRPISIEEAKKLATFPDWFKFTGKYEEQWARIGNCVPPNFMRAIAEHVRDHILSKINQ